MKYSFLFVLGIMYSQVANSQEKRIDKKNIPIEIMEYLSKNYPNTTHVKFYKELKQDSSFIEAEFTLERQEITLKFFNQTLIEKETELEFKAIESKVQQGIENYLKSNFTKYKLTTCNLVEIPNKKNMFEIYIKGTRNNKSNYLEIYFNETGEFIKLEEVEITPIQTQN